MVVRVAVVVEVVMLLMVNVVSAVTGNTEGDGRRLDLG